MQDNERIQRLKDSSRPQGLFQILTSHSTARGLYMNVQYRTYLSMIKVLIFICSDIPVKYDKSIDIHFVVIFQ